MVQLFKGDDNEQKMYAVAKAPAAAISLALDQFFGGIYGCIPLGEFLYDQQRVPLSNALKREVFISCFQELFAAFAVSGTFESYLTVLRKIFGEDAQIDFLTQGGSGLVEYAFANEDDDLIVDELGNVIYFGEPFTEGNLIINVQSSNLSEFVAIFREIVDNDYVEYEFVDQDADNIVFAGLLGIETEAELEEVVFVLAPAGIFTQVNLTIL